MALLMRTTISDPSPPSSVASRQHSKRSDNAVPCPECELPAEVMDRFALASTDGPVDHVAIACVAGHYFRMAVDRLSAKAQEQLVEPDSSRQREGGSGARWPLAQLRPEEGGADAPARR
jgi:hypothetical protein